MRSKAVKLTHVEEVLASHMRAAGHEKVASNAARLRTLRVLAVAVAVFWGAVLIAVLIWLL
jgi:hypothetical protein